jgi:hypothetical protein
MSNGTFMETDATSDIKKVLCFLFSFMIHCLVKLFCGLYFFETRNNLIIRVSSVSRYILCSSVYDCIFVPGWLACFNCHKVLFVYDTIQYKNM